MNKRLLDENCLGEGITVRLINLDYDVLIIR